MSSYQENLRYFYRVLKVSLAVVLFCLAIFFYSFQRFPLRHFSRLSPIQVEIYVDEIPLTQQGTARPPRPPRPSDGPVVAVEEAEWPEEFPVSQMTGSGTGSTSRQGSPVEISAKPLLEVYPRVSGNTCIGSVHLLILVSAVGRVTDVEVLENGTNSEKCQALAVEAAYQGRWIPAKFDGRPVSSWVNKEFRFGVKR